MTRARTMMEDVQPSPHPDAMHVSHRTPLSSSITFRSSTAVARVLLALSGSLAVSLSTGGSAFAQTAGH